jgi:hypothetical protein
MDDLFGGRANVRPPFVAQAGLGVCSGYNQERGSPDWPDYLDPNLDPTQFDPQWLGRVDYTTAAGQSVKRSLRNSSIAPTSPAKSLAIEESKPEVDKGKRPSKGKKRARAQSVSSDEGEKPGKGKKALKRRGARDSLGGIGEAMIQSSRLAHETAMAELEERKLEGEAQTERARMEHEYRMAALEQQRQGSSKDPNAGFFRSQDTYPPY